MTLVAAVPAPRCAGSRPVTRADEALARRAGHQRQAERVQFLEARHEVEILLGRLLGEAETRVEHDLARCNPRPAGDVERGAQERELVRDHVGQLLALAARVHDDEARAGVGGHRAMPGSRCRPQTSLTICAPAATASRAVSSR